MWCDTARPNSHTDRTTAPDWTHKPACRWSCLGPSLRCHLGTVATKQKTTNTVFKKKKTDGMPCHRFWFRLRMLRYLIPVLLHAKVGAAMLHKHVRLHKGLWVQQKLNSLSGCQLPLRHGKKTQNFSMHLYSAKKIIYDSTEWYILFHKIFQIKMFHYIKLNVMVGWMNVDLSHIYMLYVYVWQWASKQATTFKIKK